MNSKHILAGFLTLNKAYADNIVTEKLSSHIMRNIEWLEYDSNIKYMIVRSKDLETFSKGLDYTSKIFRNTSLMNRIFLLPQTKPVHRDPRIPKDDPKPIGDASVNQQADDPPTQRETKQHFCGRILNPPIHLCRRDSTREVQ